MYKGFLMRRHYTTSNILEKEQYNNILDMMDKHGLKVDKG